LSFRLLPIVDTVCQHMGEEPPISGTKGSGTVFFGNCNMRCVYCQNHQNQSELAQRAIQSNRTCGISGKTALSAK